VEETELTYTLSKKAVRLAEKGFSLEVMTKVLEDIMEEYTRIENDGSFVQICLNSFSLDFPINVRVSSDPRLALRQVLDMIERTLSSKDSVRKKGESPFAALTIPYFFQFLIDSPLTIYITHVPAGGGLAVGYRVKFSDCSGVDEFCNRLRCCWNPPTYPPGDYRCLGERDREGRKDSNFIFYRSGSGRRDKGGRM
jgi:hypothetical protein